MLQGTEVKSLRAGHATLVDGYADVKDGEVWLHGVHIPEYTEGTWTNHEPRRKRKLLLHRNEISKLIGKTKEGGFTLVPLSLYFRMATQRSKSPWHAGARRTTKGKAIAERDAKREAERATGRRAKGTSIEAASHRRVGDSWRR